MLCDFLCRGVANILLDLILGISGLLAIFISGYPLLNLIFKFFVTGIQKYTLSFNFFLSSSQAFYYFLSAFGIG